jgi:SAM-dependent methyltransferase
MVDRIRDFTHIIHRHRPLGPVVDLACGPGDWTLKYLDFAEHVIGIDISRDFIDAAQRSALSHRHPERTDFLCMNIVEFEEYTDVDLVCLGGLLQCLNDEELHDLFAVLARELQPGTCVYIRSNVAHSFIGSYRTAKGFYRTRSDYESRFRQCGLKIFDSFTSSSVVPAQIAKELSSIRSFRTARKLGSPLWLVHKLGRILVRKSDLYNWFLVKK